ncbi:MAG TPA: hypothetical protein VF581_06680 [Flavobacterium sp.]|jgi:hypothetical protein
MAVISPWHTTAGGFNPVRLKVSILDFDVAHKLLHDLDDIV